MGLPGAAAREEKRREMPSGVQPSGANLYDQLRPVDPSDFRFVEAGDGNLFERLIEINVAAFVSSDFEVEPGPVRERNRDFIRRCPKAFMVFFDPNRQLEVHLDSITSSEIVGYTCVLPLTAEGRDIYLRGLIRDRDWPAVLIAENGEKCRALLFFAIHLQDEFGIKKAGTRYGALLSRCMKAHVELLVKEFGKSGGEMEIWSQAGDDKMAKHYVERGFERTQYKSAEGFPLYCRKLVVP